MRKINLDETSFHILLALKAGAASGSEIIDRIRDVGTGRVPSIASIYRHLGRVVDADLVAATSGTTLGEGPGRPALEYRLTRKGRGALTSEATRLQELAQMVLGPDHPSANV